MRQRDRYEETEISTEKLEEVIKKLIGNKAAEGDGIRNEIRKYANKKTRERLENN